MIRLRRPAREPAILSKKGRTLAQDHCRLYDASQAHRDGSCALPIDPGIYNHLSVRKALDLAQSGKCCYCESRSRPFEVEHYRPKNAVRQDRGVAEERPGYYWLAYDWTNLLYACVLCNQARKDEEGDPTGKGCLFPIVDPSRRARSHHDPLADESPLLLNPYEVDPELHIAYRRHVPRGLTEQGRKTISALKLDGRSHLARRREHWRYIQRMLDLLLCDRGLPEEVQQEFVEALWDMAQDGSEYAAMTRAALRNLGLYE